MIPMLKRIIGLDSMDALHWACSLVCADRLGQWPRAYITTSADPQNHHLARIVLETQAAIVLWNPVEGWYHAPRLGRTATTPNLSWKPFHYSPKKKRKADMERTRCNKCGDEFTTPNNCNSVSNQVAGYLGCASGFTVYCSLDCVEDAPEERLVWLSAGSVLVYEANGESVHWSPENGTLFNQGTGLFINGFRGAKHPGWDPKITSPLGAYEPDNEHQEPTEHDRMAAFFSQRNTPTCTVCFTVPHPDCPTHGEAAQELKRRLS